MLWPVAKSCSILRMKASAAFLRFRRRVVFALDKSTRRVHPRRGGPPPEETRHDALGLPSSPPARRRDPGARACGPRRQHVHRWRRLRRCRASAATRAGSPARNRVRSVAALRQRVARPGAGGDQGGGGSALRAPARGIPEGARSRHAAVLLPGVEVTRWEA